MPISGLRGPIITDALYRTFKERGLKVRYVFTIDDYDPMDSQSMREQAGMAEQMGKPFFRIPSPDPAAAPDYARYHAGRYLALFADLGIKPDEVHWMRDLYGSGALDPQIDLVLRSAEIIREIHQRVAGVEHPEGWLPISVICETCGRSFPQTHVQGLEEAREAELAHGGLELNHKFWFGLRFSVGAMR